MSLQPRIDPEKLLGCISVLLSSNGGIRSSNEVKRLARFVQLSKSTTLQLKTSSENSKKKKLNQESSCS